MSNKTLNMQAVEDYFKESVSPKELAHDLDEIEHEYAMLIINSDAGPNNGQATHLHTLRELRNLLIRIQGGCEL